MIPLTNRSSTTTQKLVITLAAAATTTYPTITVASYIVLPQTKPDFAEYRSAPQVTLLAAETETTIADAPPEGSVKNVNYISVYNADTVSCTATIAIDDNGTNRNQIRATLATLETLYYEDGRGWYSTDANGAVKTSLGPTGQFTTLTVSGNTSLGDNAADSLTINAGVYSAPNQPAFLAYNSAADANATGNGTNYDFVCDTEIFDQGANYNTGTGVFTAPVAGKYLICARVLYTSLSAAMTQQNLEIITSNRTYACQDIIVTAGSRTLEVCVLADMDASDTAFPRARVANGAGDTATVYGAATGNYTMFCGRQTN